MGVCSPVRLISYISPDGSEVRIIWTGYPWCSFCGLYGEMAGEDAHHIVPHSVKGEFMETLEAVAKWERSKKKYQC